MRKLTFIFMTFLLTPLTSQAIMNFDKMFEEIKKEMADLKEVVEKKVETHVKSGYNEAEKKYFFEIKLQGFEKNDIKVQVRADDDTKFIMLTAHREVSDKGISEKKDFQVIRSLPKDADINKTEWIFANEIAVIKIPKITEKEENWITIKARS